MSRDFPALIDPWQMARGRRGFSGSWPLERFARFRELIASDEGDAAFEIEFGVDELGYSFVDVSVNATPTLICQRTLEPFGFDLQRRVRLGLIGSDADTPALPADYEPLVVPEEPVALMDLVEDELILALPLVPKTGKAPVDAAFGPTRPPGEQEQSESPFAELIRLKDRQNQ